MTSIALSAAVPAGRGWIGRVLRLPLAWKLMGANTVIVLAGWLAAYLEGRSRGGDWRIVVVLTLAFAGGLLVNVVLLRVALRPVRELEQMAVRLSSGDLDARVGPSPISDPKLERLAGALNALLDRHAQDRDRVRALTLQVVESSERERAHLAREIHESVAQYLAALLYELSAIEHGAETSEQVRRIAAARDTAGRAIDEMRLLSQSVYPRVLDDLGLEAGLRHLVRIARAQSPSVHIELLLHTPDDPSVIPAAASGVLYRVAEEGLRNAIRHASARRVDVLLRVTDDEITLDVHDDGTGFIAADRVDTCKGIGLFVMRERVALVGGQFDLTTKPGGGTTIHVRVPREFDTLKSVSTVPQTPSPVGV